MFQILLAIVSASNVEWHGKTTRSVWYCSQASDFVALTASECPSHNGGRWLPPCTSSIANGELCESDTGDLVNTPYLDNCGAYDVYRCEAGDSRFHLNPGATCATGYQPLTSSWQDCLDAAVSLGYSGDAIGFVDYSYPWGADRPQGCFQSDGNNRFHFNTGAGGSYQGTDKILCTLKAEQVQGICPLGYVEAYNPVFGNPFYNWLCASGCPSMIVDVLCRCWCEADTSRAVKEDVFHAKARFAEFRSYNQTARHSEERRVASQRMAHAKARNIPEEELMRTLGSLKEEARLAEGFHAAFKPANARRKSRFHD